VQRVLNGALAAEARSALAYALQVSEARESVLAPDARQALATIRSQLGAAATRLANLILEHGGTPDPGNFPLVATNFNFLDVPALLARVVGTIPGDAAKLDALAQAMPAPGELREQIVSLAAQKREQHKTVAALLEKLKAAAAAAPAAGAPAPAAGAKPPPKPKMSPEEAKALAAKKKAEADAKKAAAGGATPPPAPPPPAA
jgi:hypothetical protein